MIDCSARCNCAYFKVFNQISTKINIRLILIINTSSINSDCGTINETLSKIHVQNKIKQELFRCIFIWWETDWSGELLSIFLSLRKSLRMSFGNTVMLLFLFVVKKLLTLFITPNNVVPSLMLQTLGSIFKYLQNLVM